ncbi:MAG: DUF763 domain-containing protein [Deltaproteobacteria bacterium]|nr:DUF763 domain-containing protein [Deltaproteobacteria bacterium]
MVAEVIHGAPSRFSDPARFSLAHGGSVASTRRPAAWSPWRAARRSPISWRPSAAGRTPTVA